jgi:hypothetical protein
VIYGNYNGLGGSANDYFTDITLCDGSGSLNNTFLGDRRVYALFPTGAGNAAQWVPSAGSNYACVDDSPPNDDTDYVSAPAALGSVDTYAMADLPPGASSVAWVQASPYAKKTDGGAGSVQPVYRRSGTDYLGTSQAVGANYSWYPEVTELDPSSGVAWTASGVNALEAGIKAA